ncbi:MAG: hypothetical protein WD737_05865 [Gemmatimonadota bacterium]
MVAGPAHAAQAAGPSQRTLSVDVDLDRDPVAVGEPFRTSVRVRVPDGIEVAYGELAGDDTLEALGPAEIVSAAGGDIAVYTLAAWVAGQPPSAWVPIRLLGPGGEMTTDSLRLRLPAVTSMLPAGDTVLAPRPAKALFVPPLYAGIGWWWWALLLAAIGAGAAAYRILTRRREGQEVRVTTDPRRWALAQLERTGRVDDADGGGEVHRRVSWVLRVYLSQIESTWSPDLTTSELIARMRPTVADEGVVEALQRLLEAADRVKFAGAPPVSARAPDALVAARKWVAAYPPPGSGATPSRRAA